MARRIFPMSDWADGPSLGSPSPSGTATLSSPDPTTAAIGASNSPRLRSRSMSFSLSAWRNRPKSALLSEDWPSRSGASIPRADRRSVDELRFASSGRSAYRGGSHHPRGSVYFGYGSTGETPETAMKIGPESAAATGLEAPQGPENADTLSSNAAAKLPLKTMIQRATVSLHGFIQRRASVVNRSAPAMVANPLNSLDSAAPNPTASSATPSVTAPAALTSPPVSLPNRLLRSAHAHYQSHSTFPLATASSSSNRLAPPTDPSVVARSTSPTLVIPTSANTPSDVLAEQRPTTSHLHGFPSWRRLRQAASFRHSLRVFGDDANANTSTNGSASGSSNPGSYLAGRPTSYVHTASTSAPTAGLSPYFAASRDLPQQPYQETYGSLPVFGSDPEPAFVSAAASASASPPAFDSVLPASTQATPGGYGSLSSPVSTGPPVIPLHTGGAARAAAAAAFQSEMLQQQQQRQQHKWLHPDEYGNDDHESGIGIAVTSTDMEASGSASGGRRLHYYDSALGLDGMGIGAGSASASASGHGHGDEDDPSAVIRKVDFVAQLPVELAIAVLAQLDAVGLVTAARVSRAWYYVVRSQHVWRESFLREKASTYATSTPVRPGAGLGIPALTSGCDWREIARVKEQLDRNWKLGKTEQKYLNGHSDSIYCLQFDENKIITGSRDRTIRIWDMHTLACRLVIGPPEVVHDDGLLHGEDGQPAHYVTSPYFERSAESVPAAVSFPVHHKASILCLQYDDRILVTGSSDATCIVHSVTSGYRPVRRLRHHAAAVLDLCFDERYIVTCSKDVSICVWDRQTGALLKQLRGHAGPVNAVQMRGNTIVSCSGDFRVKLWNIETGRAIRELTGHTKGLACSQFSEDGRFVASAGNDRTIRIWDANTGECVREMKAHENLVRSLHIDSVSGRLVSGSYDRDIRVFDMESGGELLCFPKWHDSWVLSAKSDYRRIISTGQDPKILVMDFGAGIRGIEMLESGSGSGSSGKSSAVVGRAETSSSSNIMIGLDGGSLTAEPANEQQPGYI